MLRYVLGRLLVAVPVTFSIVLASFLLIHAVPGGPFDSIGKRPLPDEISLILEHRYGLDQPVSAQFLNYLANLLRGDLGPMFHRPGQSVSDVIAKTLPVSLQLGLMSLVLSFIVGIPAGTIAAIKHNRLVDYTATFLAVLGTSIPGLILGPVLIMILGVNLEWLPVAFWGAKPPFHLGFIPMPTADFFRHAALPVFTLGVAGSAGIARLTRAGLLEVMTEDYILTARAKGVREFLVVYRHALKNALIPVATLIGPALAGLVTGSLVVEQVFAINGIGRYLLISFNEREYFLTMAIILMYAVVLILGNLLVDVIYAWLDPRIRYE